MRLARGDRRRLLRGSHATADLVRRRSRRGPGRRRCGVPAPDGVQDGVQDHVEVGVRQGLVVQPPPGRPPAPECRTAVPSQAALRRLAAAGRASRCHRGRGGGGDGRRRRGGPVIVRAPLHQGHQGQQAVRHPAVRPGAHQGRRPRGRGQDLCPLGEPWIAVRRLISILLWESSTCRQAALLPRLGRCQ